MKIDTNIFSLIFSREKLFSYSAKSFEAIILLFVIYLIYKIINIGLDRTLKHGHKDRRVFLLVSLARSVVRYLAFFIVLISVLQQFGINITALLASAGILGLAVSFGAQGLVKDFISGIFIILENQFTIGEEIQVAGVTGRVEQMTLRMTTLRDSNNIIYTIPNGIISTVQNFSRK